MSVETLINLQNSALLAFTFPAKLKAGVSFVITVFILYFFAKACLRLMAANEKREENQDAYNSALISVVFLGASVIIATAIFVGFGYSAIVK